MPQDRAVIFANGLLPDPQAARAVLLPGALLIAADGGTRHALALGLVPSIIVGDLDSLAEEDRQVLAEAGTTLLAHPADKNQTDLELALHYAIQSGCTSIRILAALGGRLDQSLGNLAMLADPALRELDLRLDDGVEEAWFIRERATIHGNVGDTVSLLPWGVAAEDVFTTDLRWSLAGENLHPHQTRGISNEMLAETASVSLEAGLLCCIHRRNTLQDRPGTGSSPFAGSVP